MKYEVTDPENGKVVATYEKNEAGWEVYEAGGPPFLEHDALSRTLTLIDAVLQSHRDKGRVVSVK